MSGNETTSSDGRHTYAYRLWHYTRREDLKRLHARQEMKHKNLFRTIEEGQDSPEWMEPFQRRDLTEIFPT